MRLEQRFCTDEQGAIFWYYYEKNIVCILERLDHLLPCKFNRIELHTDEASNGVEQWVSFHMERPSEMEKEPFTYYCL